jgi:hypothetical protein
MKKEWYIIKDLKKFTNSIRSLVYSGFGKAISDYPDDFTEMLSNIDDPVFEKELDEFLSYNESILLINESVRKQTNKKTGSERYLITDELFNHIIETLNARLVANILSSLVKKGLLESAFDSTENDFIFWVKEEPTNEDNKEKPKTD